MTALLMLGLLVGFLGYALIDKYKDRVGGFTNAYILYVLLILALTAIVIP